MALLRPVFENPGYRVQQFLRLAFAHKRGSIRSCIFRQPDESIAEELRAHEPQRSVQFVIPDSVPASGDSRLLRIVMENLMRNAWKYTSKHPSARIEFGYDAAHGFYYVRDKGAGFDQAEAQAFSTLPAAA
jgi:signal transduction histidine kinase